MMFSEIKPEVLLQEVEDLRRNAPTPTEMVLALHAHDEWLGRVSSVCEHSAKAVQCRISLNQLNSGITRAKLEAFHDLKVLLAQINRTLSLSLTNVNSVGIPQGNPYTYFNELRKIVSLATIDLFVIDPYLDAEFVERYITQVNGDVTIKLLTTSSQWFKGLKPAASIFSTQNNQKIEIRRTTGLHDRCIFIDRSTCFNSGASFKDGAVNSPTIISQITDAFPTMLEMYDQKWEGAIPA